VRTRSSSSSLARVFRSFSVFSTFRRRGVALSFGLVAVGALVMASGGAAASSQPTVAQAQQKLDKLNNEAQRLDEQYDQVQQQVSAANQQLALVNTEAARYLSRFNSMRAEVAQIATAAYEDGSLNTPEALFTSDNPQQILNQSSILLELSSSNDAEMSAFLAAARQLSNAQASARRVRSGILALKDKLAGQKASLKKLINQQQSLLNQLSPAEQAGTGPGGGAPTTGIGAPDPLPDVSQGEQAVAFAFAQIGCPYVFGGTGPCADGFDCSGLTQAAWAAAGVAIPRTSEEQADLPAVPESDLEPGDILEFIGDGHVGIYVGDNELIDAPQTGEDVQEVAFSGWYQENFDGAVRP
jgi:cell wall-associated NlpC family hydrolase